MVSSMRARLTAWFSVCLAALIGAAVCLLVWYADYATARNADRFLAQGVARTIGESAEYKTLAGLMEDEREDIVDTPVRINIVARAGRIAASTRKGPLEDARMDPQSWRLARGRLPSGLEVVAGIPWEQTRAELRRHAAELILLAMFVVLVAAVGSWMLVGRALRPIPMLARQAHASSEGKIAVILMAPSDDSEIVELVDTLNSLLAGIARTAAAKGRFYAAASHELRTPLQALSGHLELAIGRDRSTDEYKAALNEAYTQTRRLISLTRALLTLYQIDSLPRLAPGERVDLVEVCRRSLSHFQPLVDSRRIRVDLQAPAEAVVDAPPLCGDIVARNLIENALKYADDGGLVRIAIRSEPGALLLAVVNDCAQPPNWRDGDAFEPFSNRDGAAARGNGGTGLGLTICEAIARASDWTLTLRTGERCVAATLLIPWSFRKEDVR